MRILTVVAQKGGQGKSTLTAHLTYAMLQAGWRVAVVDMDPQASLTEVTFGPGTEGEFAPTLNLNVTDMLTDPDMVKKAINADNGKFVFIAADHADSDVNNQGQILPSDYLAASKSNFAALAHNGIDCVVIDTQGGLTGLTRLALTLGTHTVMPFQFGGYDIAAIEKTRALVVKIRGKDNPRLKLLGLLACKVETSSPRIMADLKAAQESASVILPYHLANRVAVQNAAQDRKPVWQDARTGAQRAAAKEWHGVCEQILIKLT